MLTSDDWDSYGRVVPKNKHLTGKIFTQRIERNNLTLRTHIKRLARKQSASHAQLRSTKKVIGAFIENTYSTNWMDYRDLNQSVGMQGMSNSLVEKLREELSGEVVGKNFTVDAEQSFWLALVRTMYSVSLIKTR